MESGAYKLIYRCFDTWHIFQALEKYHEIVTDILA